MTNNKKLALAIGIVVAIIVVVALFLRWAQTPGPLSREKFIIDSQYLVTRTHQNPAPIWGGSGEAPSSYSIEIYSLDGSEKCTTASGGIEGFSIRCSKLLSDTAPSSLRDIVQLMYKNSGMMLDPTSLDPSHTVKKQ